MATRAQVLVAPATRRRLARDWRHLLAAVQREPAGRSARVRPCRDRLLVSAPEVQQIIDYLEAPFPTSARGVATVNRLLTDGTGPLFNHRSAGLDTSLSAAMELLAPSVSREGVRPQS